MNSVFVENRSKENEVIRRVASDRLRIRKIPTAMDVPAKMSSVAIDLGDDFNTTGAKGIGEPVTIPTAAAVANAVYNAVGVRIVSTPINPTSLVAELAAKTEGRG